MPEISIIVPNYNTEKYLSRCLDSLVDQTFKDIEIIIIDDGSTDKSVSIIKKYIGKDSRIKLIEQKNSGVATARNQGLDVATGKYLMFCDSDDWYELNMCQVMYEAIEREKVDVVCCYNFFEFEMGLSPDIKDKRVAEAYFNPSIKGKICIEKSRFQIPVVLWTKIFKKELIDKFALRFYLLKSQEDTVFWNMYAFVSKTAFYIPNKLYHYFLRGDSLSAQTVVGKIGASENLAVAEIIQRFCEQQDLVKMYHKDISMLFLQQLNFLKNSFSVGQNIWSAQQANTSLKRLPRYYRIVFIDNEFILLTHKCAQYIFRCQKRFLLLKSHIGTVKQRNKRLQKIKKIEYLITFIKERTFHDGA